MKNASTPKADQDVPEYKREQLGVGVIDPALTKAFPNSQAVNEALRGLPAVATSATRLRSRAKRPASKRVAV